MSKSKKNKKELFNDLWIMLVGAPVIGILAPIIFGMRPADPDFIQWTVVSVAITFFSWGASRKFGGFLWEKFSWDKNPLIHLAVVVTYILVVSAAIVMLVYLITLLAGEETANYWEIHKTFNLIVLLIFVFTVTIHEATYLFFLWKKELTRASDLEKENVQSKFDALKNHVNPHFLFNSLGTLSSLINSDQEKATRYVNEFSKIYRYFLDVNSNDLVTIEEETDFINSYIFLQQIRYGDGFTYTNLIDRQYYSEYMLPLTLQLLVENALKHNTFSAQMPLHIEIFINEKKRAVVVQNNYQPRRLENSPKTGLKNLEQRYLNFAGKKLSYQQTETFFTVEVPILTNES